MSCIESLPVYQKVINRVLEDNSRLPSLPDIVFKIRDAIEDGSTTVESLANLISKDPALTAHLVKSAGSPIFRRAVPPKTVSEVVGLLGFSATNSLVMLYSTKHMVELNDSLSIQLFNHTWERLVVKTSIASFLAQKLGYRPVDRVQMALLLTEVGSLSVLASILDVEGVPNKEVYFTMCREFSKTLGTTLLQQWNVDDSILEVVQRCGNWEDSFEEQLNLLDIANLALYCTVQHTVTDADLPPLSSLAAYKKIPTSMSACSQENKLDLITDNQEEIDQIIETFK